MTDKCYSADDETFNYRTLGDLLDSIIDPQAGDTYYEADCKPFTTEDVMSLHTVNSLLESFDEQAYEELGEVYDSECSDVPEDAKAELQALISAWAAKHISLDRFWKIVGETRECKLTEDDLK